MGSINFHLRASASAKKKAGRLVVRVIHGRETLNKSLSYKLHPEEWDGEKQEVVIAPGTTRATYLREVDKELREERQRADLLLLEMDRKGAYTVGELKAAYLGLAGKATLKDYAEKLAGEMEQNRRERTARAYRTAVRRFTGFTGNEDLRLEELDAALLERFEGSLEAEGRRRNTVVFYLRILRAICNKAVREGVFTPPEADIFKDVRTTGEATRKKALDGKEMAAVRTLEVAEPALRRSQLLFLFSFFARGVPFVDLFHLKKTDISGGVLSYVRRKTGQRLEVKLTPELRRILRLLGEGAKGSPYLLPLAPSGDGPSYRAYDSALRAQNLRLKKIAELCGLGKPLSTHVARHSWATIAKAAGQPVQVISEGLGHTSVQTTAIYLASFDRSVLDKANERVARTVMA